MSTEYRFIVTNKFDRDMTLKFLRGMQDNFKHCADQIENAELSDHDILTNLLAALLEMDAVMENNIHVYASLYKMMHAKKAKDN